MPIPADTAGYDTITIQASQVPADITDFVIYVDLADMSTSWWSNVNTDGAAIRVFDSSGLTEYAYELVDIDTTGQTGELHFKLSGTLSSTSNTDIRIYCGGTASSYGNTDTYGRNNVWTNHLGVWHFQNDPSGTAPQLVDASGNGHDGTSGGSMTTTDLVSGKIGKAWDFDGSNDMVDVGNIANLKYISGWVETGLLTGLHRSYSWNVNDWSLRWDSDGSGKSFYAGNSSNTLTEFGADNTLYHFSSRYDGSAAKFYDGAAEKATIVASEVIANQSFVIGESGVGSHFWLGIISEIRVSQNDLGVNWISTEYNNQSSPATFFGTAVWTAAGGGAILSAGAGDTVAFSSSESAVAQLLAQVSDNLQISDSGSVIGLLRAFLNDSIHISDTIVALSRFIVDLGDTINIDDISNSAGIYSRNISDQITLAETVTTIMAAIASANETLHFSDSATLGSIVAALAADGITLSEDALEHLRIVVNGAETIRLNESSAVQVTFVVECTDAAMFNETIHAIALLKASLSDSIQFSENLTGINAATLPNGSVAITFSVRSASFKFLVKRPNITITSAKHPGIDAEVK